MDGRLESFLVAIAQAGEPTPVDLEAALRNLPEPGALPSPWEAWTLIGLVRHRDRQLWVESIIRTRLRGSPAEIASLGSFGHPHDIAQRGPVPGLPEWEYFFHGCGCCITHKVDGEAIDVDFCNDSAEYFDTYFYKNYLESLRQPEPPEQRLRELHPSLDSIRVAIEDLLAIRALTPLEDRDSHPYRVSNRVLEKADAIDAFCSAWTSPERRLWLAALIGDWPAVDIAAMGRPELTAITSKRAERCLERRWERLRLLLNIPYGVGDALRALADLKAPDLDSHLEAALKGPPSGTISAALDVIGRDDDPKWCVSIFDLLSRTDPSERLPAPHIWITSLKFLLRHQYRRTDVIAALADAERNAVGEAVLLALEHAPDLAIPLIRKGIFSEVPIVRIEVAATLALINQPWSLRELLRALSASDEQEKTADARAALLEIGTPDAERAVLTWEEKNPHENEVGSYLEIRGRKLGPFYSLGEIALKDRAAWVRYQMQKWHDRVMNLRRVTPPNPPRQ